MNSSMTPSISIYATSLKDSAMTWASKANGDRLKCPHQGESYEDKCHKPM